jgi:hypothetical protein
MDYLAKTSDYDRRGFDVGQAMSSKGANPGQPFIPKMKYAFWKQEAFQGISSLIIRLENY